MLVLQKKQLIYVVILGLLSALGPLCLDLYLPALPELAADLNTSTVVAQLSLTAGMIGLGLGQLVFGPVSDKLGRRKPLFLSLTLFLIASVWCAFVKDITHLFIARFLQGIAGAGGVVLSRAVARDLYSGYDLTRFFAMLMLVHGLAPIAAPVLGGALLTYMSWRGLFIALAVIGAIVLMLVRGKLQETLPQERRRPGSIFSAYAALGRVITQRRFMGLCLTQGFIAAGMFAYIGASPFVLQQIYGLSPQVFSFCFAINSIGLIIAAQVAARLSGRWGEYRVLKLGLLIAALASSSLFISGMLNAPLVIILIALFFTVLVNSFIGITASSLAMQSLKESAGSGSALIGVTMFTLGATSIPLSGIGGTSVQTMTLTILGCYLMAILTFIFIVEKPAERGIIRDGVND